LTAIAITADLVIQMNNDPEPSYVELIRNGEFAQRVKLAYEHLQACDVCPLNCGVDRLAGELGICKTGELAQISSYGPHPGEERPLSGWRGSGTIFFSRCNLRCVYCQNADISQMGHGQEVDSDKLGEIMLKLQRMGCHNINLVSPSHVIPQILAAVKVAGENGLHLPLVYNTGGYDSLEMLKLLDGVVDIYMPDMKYGDETIARKYSLVRDYPEINQKAVLEMHRQVGDLQIDPSGIAQRGLLIRHLVLPNDLASSEVVLRFIAEKISRNTYINIMDQYHPAYRATEFPDLNRRITPEEYHQVIAMAKNFGLTRLDS
jgi:putative pyruvate formate lyase activating enzyme